MIKISYAKAINLALKESMKENKSVFCIGEDVGFGGAYGATQNLKEQLDFVNRGDVIGLVGNTGISSGPHLHFEVWREFIAVDPLIYFPEYRIFDLTSSNE